MPSTEEAIQKTVLSLEAGDLARLVRRAALAVAVALLCWFYLVHEFRGLSMAEAMDQAQIGREILRGHGFQTEFARPLALGELRRQGRDDAKIAVWRDTYNAPLPPLLDAAVLYLPVQHGQPLTRKDLVYSGDRAIATLQVFCFLASVAVLYLLAVELFDKRLAFMACGLVLVCDMMWEYSLSGLPQMWLLLLFNSTLYTLLRAMRARSGRGAGGTGLARRPRAWASGCWPSRMPLPSGFSCPPWSSSPCFSGRAPGAAPSCWRFFWPLCSLAGAECRRLRRFPRPGHIFRPGWHPAHGSGPHAPLEIDLKDVSGAYYLQNIRANLVSQMNRLIEYFGWSCVAPLAFVSLLHPFKRPQTAAFRWLAIGMWAGAVLGMGVFGLKEYPTLAANQLHLLFVPVFICYGMAYSSCSGTGGSASTPRKAASAEGTPCCAAPSSSSFSFSQACPCWGA